MEGTERILELISPGNKILLTRLASSINYDECRDISLDVCEAFSPNDEDCERGIFFIY